ncbi:magnesium transporter CorA family protein [Acidithiobacillus ferriphilus]|uniref:magnesium transporter CorA family protein n=1 Tax=Acidithiobacillus ferriphilus TaxID=1689834 RepID=UPI002DBCFEF7|nr:magnesium transporter CorA family protein [Acidithiobacillus ferriphilus]MEB8535920.1 magnesium transporter CorA family protein [Acidithiobacillus ferriphilus]
MNSAVQTLLEQPTTPLRQTAPGWLWLHQPDTETIRRTAAEYAVDEDFFHDVLDPDEHPRLMREDGKLFIILQVPWKQPSVAGKPHWDLRPMGIIFQAHGLLTIGSVQWPFLQALFDAYRTKPSEDLTRDLLVKMIRGVTDVYEQALHDLSESMTELERLLDKTQRNADFYRLLEVSNTFTRFHAALAGNVGTVFKTSRTELAKWDEQQRYHLKLAVADLQAVHDSAEILAQTMSSMMDAYAGMIQNNINHGLKVLTVLALVLYIPAMVATFYGVNPPIPLQHTHWIFWVVIPGSFVVSITLAAYYRHIRWI